MLENERGGRVGECTGLKIAEMKERNKTQHLKIKDFQTISIRKVQKNNLPTPDSTINKNL